MAMPIHRAAEEGHVPMVEALVRLGADLADPRVGRSTRGDRKEPVRGRGLWPGDDSEGRCRHLLVTPAGVVLRGGEQAGQPACRVSDMRTGKRKGAGG